MIVNRMLDPAKASKRLTELGITKTEQWRAACGYPHGLIIVAGKTNSGKSTTLISSLREQDRIGKSIYTIEDPIEHRVDFLTQMAVNWRVIVTALKSLVSVRGSGEDDDDPIMPGRHYAIFTLVALVIAAVFASVFMGLSVIVVVMLIIFGGVIQNIIATRAAAQTAFNPARVMGVLLEGITALAGAPSAAANLTGAGFVAGSGAQAGNLTGDMAYGRWLRVPSRWQFWAQLTTVVPCSLMSAWVFSSLIATQPLTLEGEGLPAPVAKMWAATALIFEGTTEMPPFAWESLGIGAAAGAIYMLIEYNERIKPWIPCSIGLGIGLVLPIAYDLAFFAGGIVLWVIIGHLIEVRPITLTTIAVGCIVAEGLGGVLKPVLALAGVL